MSEARRIAALIASAPGTDASQVLARAYLDLAEALRLSEETGHALADDNDEQNGIIIDLQEALRLAEQRADCGGVNCGKCQQCLRVHEHFFKLALEQAEQREAELVSEIKDLVRRGPIKLSAEAGARLEKLLAAQQPDEEEWQITYEKIDFAPIWNQGDFEKRAKAQGWKQPDEHGEAS